MGCSADNQTEAIAVAAPPDSLPPPTDTCSTGHDGESKLCKVCPTVELNHALCRDADAKHSWTTTGSHLGHLHTSFVRALAEFPTTSKLAGDDALGAILHHCWKPRRSRAFLSECWSIVQVADARSASDTITGRRARTSEARRAGLGQR